MSIYEFPDFRLFLRSWIAAQPKRGHGQGSRIAKALGVSTTMVSQVLGGAKPLSPELAVELCRYLSLDERETDCFFLLVELDRAGTAGLRSRLEAKLAEAHRRARSVAGRIRRDRELDDAAQSVYYSDWTYTGVRNLLAVPGFDTVDAIAARLMVPRAAVAGAVEFLLAHGLAVREAGKLAHGPAWTHVEAGSPFAAVHHRNWRARASERLAGAPEQSLHFTSPMSLSEEAAEEVRGRLLALVERVQKAVRPSASETVRCLNIDWFEY